MLGCNLSPGTCLFLCKHIIQRMLVFILKRRSLCWHLSSLCAERALPVRQQHGLIRASGFSIVKADQAHESTSKAQYEYSRRRCASRNFRQQPRRLQPHLLTTQQLAGDELEGSPESGRRLQSQMQLASI